MGKLHNYMSVILDQNATILKLECTLLDFEMDSDEYIGKNWFNTFIEQSDRDQVLKVFNDVFEGKNELKPHMYDIRCGETHKFMDFDYEVIVKEDKKLLYSTGVEHFQT